MAGLCDRCNEKSSHLMNIGTMSEMAAAARLGYRNICTPCYDDLIAEARESDDREEDRRAEPRALVSIKANISGNTAHMDAFSEEIIIEEISPSGLRLRTARDVDVGAVLSVSVPSYDIQTSVIVVWHDEGERCIGLRVVEPNDGWSRLWAAHSTS